MRLLRELLITAGAILVVAILLDIIDGLLHACCILSSAGINEALYIRLVLCIIIMLIASYLFRKADTPTHTRQKWFLRGCFLGAAGFGGVYLKIDWVALSDTAKLVGILAVLIAIVLYAGIISWLNDRE